jgi:hypothetical protein
MDLTKPDEDVKRARKVKFWLSFFTVIYSILGPAYFLKGSFILASVLQFFSAPNMGLFIWTSFMAFTICISVFTFVCMSLMWSGYNQKKYDRAILFALLPLTSISLHGNISHFILK